MRKFMIVFLVMVCLSGVATAVTVEQSDDNPCLFYIAEMEEGDTFEIQMTGTFLDSEFTFISPANFDGEIFYDFSNFRNGTFMFGDIERVWTRHPGSRITDGESVDAVRFNLIEGKEYSVSLSGELYQEDDNSVFLIFTAYVYGPDVFIIEIPRFIGTVDILVNGLLCAATTIHEDAWDTHTFNNDTWVSRSITRQTIIDTAKSNRAGLSGITRLEQLSRYDKLIQYSRMIG